MSLKENLQDFNYTVKEAYYDLEDRIGFPPILILALLIAGILLYFYLFQPAPLPPVPEERVTATFYFKDQLGRYIENLSVSLEFDGNSFKKKTGVKGKLSISLPKNSSLRVLVKDPDYEEFDKTYKAIESNLKEVIVLKLAKMPLKKKLLRFEDEKGLIKGKRITAIVICRDGREFTVVDEDADGLIEVELPEGCEDIRVRVNLPGYEEIETGYLGSINTKVIVLKKKEIPKGSLQFKFVDLNGGMIVNKDFKLTIEKDAEKITKTSQGYAIIRFKSIPIGTYSAAFTDESGEYVVTNLSELKNIVVERNQTTEKNIVLSRKVKGTITVSVVDEDTGESIQNAIVILSDELNRTIAELNTGENAESVVFNLYDKGVYFVTAKREGSVGTGYFPKTVQVLDLNVEITIALEKITEKNLGRTIVTVRDEDGIPVRDARVMFRYKDTGAIVPLNSEKDYKLSDVNGKAEFFLGSIEKKVYAYAVKYPAEGGSEQQAKQIKALELNEFEVTIVIGKSRLELKTIDSSGSVLSETFFEVFDQDGVSVTNGRVPMVSGQAVYELKADKIVYLVFSKEGYLDYQSEQFQLWPNETFTITALMRRVGEILQPSIEFKGAFENNELAESLRAGKQYEFKFTLVFPDNEELDRVGFHFRVGEKQSIEEEDAYIITVNAPDNDFLVLGKTYTPPNNEASEEPAIERAKWASIEWLNPEQGIYNISIGVKIKKTVYPNTRLSFYYRAWSVKDNKFVRTPYDEVLGEQGSLPEKNGLYANTFLQTYFEGSRPFCEQEFCIMSEWLYDKQEDIFLSKPYSMKVLGDYNFIFSLLNNSSQPYKDMRLVIKNMQGADEKHDVKIKSFIFYNADGNYFKESVQDYEFELSNLGHFTYSKDLNLNISLSPRKQADTQLLLQLIGDKVVIFEKRFDFHVIAENEMRLELTPKDIIPFKETELKVKIREQDNNNAIANALVRMIRESPDGLYQVETEFTSNAGEVVFNIPPSIPLTKIKIEAEKIGFAPKSKELIIGESVIDFSPEILYSSLDTVLKKDETLNVTLSNNSGTDFLINSIQLHGDFKGILNEDAINAYLMSWLGTPLSANSTQETALPKIVLSMNAEDYMKGHESLQGELEIVLLSPEFFVEYTVIIPVHIEVSLGGLPENAPCVNIDGVDVPDWSATIINNRATTEFEIYNACIKGGKKIDVKNLQAMLVWEEGSKKAGILELTIFNPDGSAISEVLKPGEWIVFWPEMTQSTFGSYHAVLTFTPKTGYMNETAGFKVLFDAEVETDEGRQKINNGSVFINGSILNLNLDDCISMPGAGEKVVLNASDEEVSFDIDASECNAEVSVMLCMGDPKCKGGTKDGGISVTPMEFTLSKGSPVQTITVYREQVPGLYGIPVYARLSNTSFQKVRTIDLLVEPDERLWFSLNRYEAILSRETDWKDTIELYNKAPLDLVNITAKYCTKCRTPNKPPKDCVWNQVLQKQAEARDWTHYAQALAWGIGVGAGCFCILTTGGVKECVEIGKSVIGIASASGITPINEPVAYFSKETPIKQNEKRIAELAGIDPITSALICGFLGIFTYLFALGKNCEYSYQTMPMRDYIVLLQDDPAKSLSLEKDLFGVSWAEFNNPMGEFGVETAPIELLNKSKTASVESLYEVLTVSATEHIHNDPTHTDPKMTMDNANFGEFNIPDTGTRKYEQKFHLKFKTKERIDLELPPLEDFYSCVEGARIGITGRDARPKIRLNWDWGEKGIGLHECNADREGIYCDATQFSIFLSKRIHRIEQFLAENNYDLKCPTHPQSSYWGLLVDEMNAKQSTHVIEEDKIGLKQITKTIDSDLGKATLSIVIENKTSKEASATIRIGLSGPNNYFEECEKTITVEALGEQTIECGFADLKKDNFVPYIATAFISESSKTEIDETQLKTGFFLRDKEGKSCWLPFSTQKYQGYPIIEYFFNKNIPNWSAYINEDNVKWPPDWPGETEEEKIEYLRSLFEFKANLIKDGYSVDFQKDFASYYSGSTFFEVPSWFYSGSSNQLVDYFANLEKLKFKQKYSSETTLPGPGTYEVYITIDFGKDDWSLYKEGKPKGTIKIEFYKIREPQINSVFYYLPFDGLIGFESINGRQEYGLNYVNQNNEILIKSAPYEVWTTHSTASNALMTMNTFEQQDLKQLNSSAAARGNLLSIEMQGSEPVLVFSPSYATPIIMKVEQEKSSSSFSSEFTFLENEQPIITGNNLSFWTGLGQCADFTGQPIREVFDFYADSRSGEKSYKIPWDAALFGGTVYLYSTFYTPLENSYFIKSNSDNVWFVSPDMSEARAVEVNGIKGMPNNSKNNNDSIKTVEKVLELVEDGYVCVTNSGSKSSFWWNPKALKDFKGEKLSVTEFEQSLLPGKTCIGSTE